MARWRELLTIEVRQLLAVLAPHFAVEERDGYMRQMVCRRPELAARAAVLRDQHAAIQAGLETLLECLRGGQEIPAGQAQLRDILTVLRAHEDAEDELIQDALCRDIGGPG